VLTDGREERDPVVAPALRRHRAPQVQRAVAAHVPVDRRVVGLVDDLQQVRVALDDDVLRVGDVRVEVAARAVASRPPHEALAEEREVVGVALDRPPVLQLEGVVVQAGERGVDQRDPVVVGVAAQPDHAAAERVGHPEAEHVDDEPLELRAVRAGEAHVTEAPGVHRHVVLHAQRLALHRGVELEDDPHGAEHPDRAPEPRLPRRVAEDREAGGGDAPVQLLQVALLLDLEPDVIDPRARAAQVLDLVMLLVGGEEDRVLALGGAAQAHDGAEEGRRALGVRHTHREMSDVQSHPRKSLAARPGPGGVGSAHRNVAV
jgi:hypothetical protein